MTSPPTLSHAVTTDGQAAPEFGYHPGGGCPVYQVPGSGATVYLLRTWTSVSIALRHPAVRDLAAITPEHALAGVTLQRPGGLLRLTAPAAEPLRAVLNPIWGRGECEVFRPVLRQLAGYRATVAAGSAAGPVDLGAAFITPYVHDLAMLAAGLATPAEAGDLAALSDCTTGTLLYGPGDHARVQAAWDELYDWTAALATRWQAAARLPASPVTQALRAARLPAGPSLAARSAVALAAAGLPPKTVHEAVTTVLNGIPTVERHAGFRCEGFLAALGMLMRGSPGDRGIAVGWRRHGADGGPAAARVAGAVHDDGTGAVQRRWRCGCG